MPGKGEGGDLTTAEAAALLGVRVRQVYHLLKNSQLEGAYQLQTERGPVWRIPRAAVEKRRGETLEGKWRKMARSGGPDGGKQEGQG